MNRGINASFDFAQDEAKPPHGERSRTLKL